MKKLNLLLSKAPSEILFETLGRFVLKTKSTQHESLVKYKKDTLSRPIFLFGFARSGTTTYQRILSDTFHYNASFEPIGFNHTNYNEDEFSQCAFFFRGAPSIHDLPLYCIGGTPFSALHAISNQDIHKRVMSFLENYIKHIFDYYGQNVIIKELRLIPNLPSIEKISEHLCIYPIYVLLRCNPLMVLYTYYRLGGLIETTDYSLLRVNEIYEYRKITYSSLGLFEDIMSIECRNKFDKLLVSVLSDQTYMQHYACINPDNCILVDFDRAIASVKKISERFLITKKETSEILIKRTNYYEDDPFFMKYIRRKINPNLRRLIDKDFSSSSTQPSPSLLNFRIWGTFLRHRLCEATSQFNK